MTCVYAKAYLAVVLLHHVYVGRLNEEISFERGDVLGCQGYRAGLLGLEKVAAA